MMLVKCKRMERAKWRSEDKKISIAIMSPFAILVIQYFILIVFNLTGTSLGETVQLISKVLVGVFFLLAFPSVLRRSKLKLTGIYFFAIFIFLLYFLIFPENREYLRGLVFPVFFISLPAFVYSLSIYDLLTFKETMKKTGYIVFSLGVLLSMFVILGKATIEIYSMPLSYYILMPTIIFLDQLMEKYTLNSLILSSISLLIILSFGSRGALLCIFILLKLLRPGVSKTHKRMQLQSLFV